MTPAVAIALGLGLTAIIEDLRRRKLPNWLTATGVAAGIALAVPRGWSGLWPALAGAALGFAVLLPLFLMRGMGGGDIKLMAAFGALLGPTAVLLAAMLAAAFGAVLATGFLLARPRTSAVPYAPAIVLGAWVALLGGGI
jgi:prepilin peptidase CpaA